MSKHETEQSSVGALLQPVNVIELQQRLLVAQHKDVTPRLEELHRELVDPCTPPSAWCSLTPKIASTVSSKALVAACMPQPAQFAVTLLSSMSQRLPVDAASLESFVHVVAHQLLLTLWQFGEDYPTVAAAIEKCLLSLYSSHARARSAIRKALYGSLHSYHASSSEGVPHSVVATVVAVLAPIARGFCTPLRRSHEDDMIMYLSPLLRSNKGAQVAAVSASEFYLQPLVALIRVYLSHIDIERVSDVMARLFRDLLPGFQEGKLNSSLAVVSTVNKLVDELDGDAFGEVHQELMDVASRACVSDYPALAVKGLKLVQSVNFLQLCRPHAQSLVEHLASRLWLRKEVSWSADVRAHTLKVWHVLQHWSEEHAGATFRRAAVDAAFGGREEEMDACLAALEAAVSKDEDEARRIEAQRVQRQGFAQMLAAVRTATKHMNFVFGRTLGSGSFGNVKYARLIERDVAQCLWYDLAIKEISRQVVSEQDCEAQLRRELEIHQALTLASEGAIVVPMFCVLEDPKWIYVVTQFCKHGDLFECLLADGVMKDELLEAHRPWVAVMLLRIAQALVFIHANGYYYGDVKPENVLLRSDPSALGGFSPLLCDFGASMTLSEAATETKFSGTLEYAAPELLRVLSNSAERPHLTSKNDTDSAHEPSSPAASPLDGRACDAWAFGCLCVQLLLGDVPYGGASTPEGQLAVIQGTSKSSSDHANQKQRMLINDGRVPPFVRSLLDVDPRKRLRLEDVVREDGGSAHLWFQKYTLNSQQVVPPPKVIASSSYVSRNSGRRDSMMWKRANMEEVRICGSASLVGLVLEEEPEGVVAVGYQVRNTIGAPGSESTGVVNESTSRRALPEYMTVMPRRRQ